MTKQSSGDVRADPTTQSPEPGRWRLPLVLALLVLAVAAPVLHPRGGEQQASRYALTAALWDYNTVEIDNYAHVLGRDRAVRDGVTYSDKAPGQPFLAVPFYGLYRIAGGEPADEGEVVGVDWGLWWVTLWTAAVPAAILAVLMYSWAREIEPRWSLPATLALSLGTLLLVYSTLLFGHVLAAVFVFAMFLTVRSEVVTTRGLLLAGFLGGAAVLTEYPMVLIVLLVTAAAFVRHRTQALGLLLGGLPAVGFLAWYNWRVTGSPLVLSYQWAGFSGPLQEEADTLEIFAGPQIERVVDVLFAQRGLLVATPVIIIALLGIALLWKRSERVDSIVVVGALLALFAVQGSWGSSFAGGAGPRYLTPALPFLAAPLALAWARWRRAAVALAALSVLTMAAATLTNPQLPSGLDAGLGLWLTLALNGEFAPILFVEIMGSFGWVIYLVAIGGSVLILVRANSRRGLDGLVEPAESENPPTPIENLRA